MEKVIKNCRGVKKCNNGVDRSDKEKQNKSLEYCWDLKKMRYIKEKNTQELNK